MTLDLGKTLDGKYIIGDHHDESAPLVTVEFSNEMAGLDEDTRHRFMLAVCDLVANTVK